jgi:di/tricarboxylate transporter
MRGGVVIVMLALMILAATLGVPMMIATLTTAVLFVITGLISIRQARQSIRWNLLVLIASAFAFGNALQATGVATLIGHSLIAVVGSEPHFLIAGIFITTLVVTEMITNNAAALLIFPIAAQAVRIAGYTSPDSLKAVAVTVAIAASCSFMTPIGYQTNTIVYGPGGYKFTDYFKVGAPLSLLLLIIATAIIPYVWPLNS